MAAQLLLFRLEIQMLFNSSRRDRVFEPFGSVDGEHAPSPLYEPGHGPGRDEVPRRAVGQMFHGVLPLGWDTRPTREADRVRRD